MVLREFCDFFIMYTTCSACWGNGMVGMASFFWLNAIGVFSLALNAPHCAGLDAARGWPSGRSQWVYLTETTLALLAPLLFAVDVATTSTRCDQLRSALNTARTKLLSDTSGYDTQCYAALEQIRALENAMDNLHRRQGLGFVVLDVPSPGNVYNTWNPDPSVRPCF